VTREITTVKGYFFCIFILNYCYKISPPRLLGTTLLALNVGVGSVADCQCGTYRWLFNSRSTEAVLGRGSLVLSAVLLETTVLRRLVGLAVGSAGGLATLLALDVWVGSVGSTESVLRRDTLVGLAVLAETIVLVISSAPYDQAVQ